MSNKVQFLDLTSQFPLIRNEIEDKFVDIIENTAFIQGQYVEEFERKFASLHNIRGCVTVASGTLALFTTLKALNISGKVIVPVNTFIATAEAVELADGEIVLGPVESNFGTLDTDQLEGLIDEDTEAIMPVHLWGNPCNMDKILELAHDYDLYVIEDVAQAHLSRYKGKLCGTFGDAGCFSFYPSKTLGSWGNAGATITDDKELLEKLRIIRSHGRVDKYTHQIIGLTCEMNAFQGAVLSTKVKHIEDWVQKRKEKAELYRKLLEPMKEFIGLPEKNPDTDPIYYVFSIRVSNRDQLRCFLQDKNNIDTGIHYPTPLHLQPSLQHLGYIEGDFPVAERMANQTLSLPFYENITEEEMRHVANALREFYAN